MAKDFLTWIKNILPSFLSIAAFCIFWGGLIYLGTSRSDNTPIRKESWTVQMLFYNPLKKSVDSIYTNSQAFDDTIINFEDANHKLWEKASFLSYKELDNSEEYGKEILLNNGLTYKFLYIDSGRCCRPKSILDSIKIANKDNTNEDDYE